MAPFRFAARIADPGICFALTESLPVIVDWCDRLGRDLDLDINHWCYCGPAADLVAIETIRPVRSDVATEELGEGFVVLTDCATSFLQAALTVCVGKTGWQIPAGRSAHCQSFEIPRVIGWLLDTPRETETVPLPKPTFVEFFQQKTRNLPNNPAFAVDRWHEPSELSAGEQYWDRFVTACAHLLSKNPAAKAAIDDVEPLSVGLAKRSVLAILRNAHVSGDHRGVHDLIRLQPWAKTE